MCDGDYSLCLSKIIKVIKLFFVPLSSILITKLCHIYLRNDEQFTVPFARLAVTERQPLTRLPKAWLDLLCENIKIERNKKIFKTKNSKNTL